MLRKKIFIGKWCIPIFIGAVSTVIGGLGFIISDMGMGVAFSLFAIAIIARYIAFVPHSFIFDNEKITVIYVFKTQIIKYDHIKSCDKEESGIRNYPWGTYYHIITDKPFGQEFRIPSTKEFDVQIKRHFKSL